MSDDDSEKVKSVCKGMGRYYRSMNREYDSNFSNFFDENGYDDETIAEDYAQGDPLSISSIDFAKDDDDNFDFPFGAKTPSSELKKAIFIWDIIKKIDKNPDIQFDPTAPTYDAEYFKLDDKDKRIDAIREEYKKQCPAIFHQGLSSDTGMLYILAVTAKHKNDYILHLVDDFSRHRIKNIDNKAYTENQWILKHTHFNKTKLLKTPFAKDQNKLKLPGDFAELIKASVASFGKRCCAQLLLNNTKVINDSIQQIVSYMVSAVAFIKGTITNANKTKKGVCPFIVDFCWAVGEPMVKNNQEEKNKESDNQDDGSDDDDDDEQDEQNDENEKKFIDLIGDVPAKLKKNNLKYGMTTYNCDVPPQPEVIQRIYGIAFDNLRGNQLEEEKGFVYPFKKRLISLVDRRKSKNNTEISDAVYMFEPASKKYTHNIPDEPVSLWAISASKTSLLPNMNYDEKDAIGAPNANRLNVDDEKKNQDEKDKNIGATHHCKNGLLIMSFIVKGENVIKCYLYYGGGVIRFFPEDIKTVFPTIFNMDYGGNRDYIQNDQDLDGLIDKMKGDIVDEEFAKFQENY